VAPYGRPGTYSASRSCLHSRSDSRSRSRTTIFYAKRDLVAYHPVVYQVDVPYANVVTLELEHCGDGNYHITPLCAAEASPVAEVCAKIWKV
jgi:hypothetical protein